MLQDLAVLLEWALYFLPGHEFTHLLGQFPEFLKAKSVGPVSCVGRPC